MNIEPVFRSMPTDAHLAGKVKDAKAYLHLLQSISLVTDSYPVTPTVSVRDDNVILMWQSDKVTVTAEFTGDNNYVYTKSTPDQLKTQKKNLRDVFDFILP